MIQRSMELACLLAHMNVDALVKPGDRRVPSYLEPEIRHDVRREMIELLDGTTKPRQNNSASEFAVNCATIYLSMSARGVEQCRITYAEAARCTRHE